MKAKPEASPTTGRTLPDLLVHFLGSSRAILVTTFSAVVACSLVVSIVWTIAHNMAKSDSEVNVLWGLVKYQKNSSNSVVQSSSTVSGIRHTIWKDENIQPVSPGGVGWGTSVMYEPVAILDGTISFWASGQSLYLTGVNIQKISVAARNSVAQAIEPRRIERDSQGARVHPTVEIHNCVVGCVVEISYANRVLRMSREMETFKDDKQESKIHSLVIEPITAETLLLQPFAVLREPVR